MLKDEGWIGHSKSQHHVNWHDGDNTFQKGWQVCVDVSTIRTGVFGGKPDFHYAFFDCLFCTFDNSVGVIRAQFAPSMTSFAIGARSKAPRRQWYDLDQRVLSDLWKIQDG